MKKVLQATLIALVAISALCSDAAPVQGKSTKGERHFILRDMDGDAYDVSNDLADGKRVALIFWQTWCGSCRKEAPAVAEAARQFDGRVAFYGVVSGPDNVVDDEKVREFAADMKLPYPQIRDRDLRVTKAFEVKGTPTIIILGDNNRIVYRDHHLPKDWSSILTPRRSLKNSLRAGTVKHYR